jgi:preprotein translocase subunit SecA
MDKAEMALMRAWGLTVWEQVKNSPVGMLNKKVRETLANTLGQEKVEILKAKKLAETEGEERRAIIEALGRRGVTETYRQLILRVISELWIEYLTKMEALRVSIGLEAYAQRDPLVQYKAQASEMFQQLFSDMRMGVVTRMFSFRPRQQQAPTQTTQAVPQPKLEAESGNSKPAADQPSSGNGQQSSGSGKRKRKRKRK